MNNLKYSLYKYNYLYDKKKYVNKIRENILFRYKKIYEYNHSFIYKNYFKYSCLDYYELEKKNQLNFLSKDSFNYK